jgi:hypothetical protein
MKKKFKPREAIWRGGKLRASQNGDLPKAGIFGSLTARYTLEHHSALDFITARKKRGSTHGVPRKTRNSLGAKSAN